MRPLERFLVLPAHPVLRNTTVISQAPFLSMVSVLFNFQFLVLNLLFLYLVDVCVCIYLEVATFCLNIVCRLYLLKAGRFSLGPVVFDFALGETAHQATQTVFPVAGREGHVFMQGSRWPHKRQKCA